MTLVHKEFSELSSDIKENIAKQLYSFWKQEYHDSDIKSFDQLIEHLSKEIYKCFVFFDSSSDFVGTACVNTDTGKTIKFNTNFFICNLFITESHRKEGHGKYILKYAEDFLKLNNHSTVTLYCKKDVYDFYIKQQYQDFGPCPKDKNLTCMMKFIDHGKKLF